MTDTTSLLAPFVAKLATYAFLGSADRRAILALPYTVHAVEPGEYLVRAGERAENCCVILSGLACRARVRPNAPRQILSVHMKGDGVDTQNALLAQTDHDIQALTTVEAAFIPAAAMSELISTHPGAARAIWTETLVHASIHREWIVNLGTRDPRTRLAHLLCELGILMETAGIAKRDRFELVMSHAQLADATGLNPVLVSRSLHQLMADGVMRQDKRIVEIDDWRQLARTGEFDPAYLHLAAA